MIDLETVDYYRLLGVSPTASPDEIRRAFHAFAAMHHPDRHAAAHPEIRAAAAAWFRRGTEAYRVLMNPDERRLYDMGLAEGRVRFDPTLPPPRPSMPAADAPLQTQQPRAIPFLKKAVEALAAGNVSVAKMNLQFVLQFDPSNAVVKAKLESL